jgi:MFS family permease
VAWLFAIFAAASFVMQAGLMGPLTRLTGEVAIAVLGSLGSAVGMLLIGQAHHAAVLMFAVALFGAGFGTTTPALLSLASKAAPEDARGFGLGVLQSSGGLARTIGPLLGGALFQRIAPGAPFVGGCMAALVAAALAATHRSKTAPRMA